MDCLLSIVIPVYNAELYLERCVKSALDSEAANYEIILIDDGSTDGSENICKQFQRTDSRVRAKHYENKGVSSARNAGVEMAKGKMIFFLDADDYLEPGSVDQLLFESEQDNAEFIIFSYNIVHSENDKKRKLTPFREGELDISLFIKCLITSSDMNYCWGKLYNKAILTDNKISFNTCMKIGEDVDFQIQYVQLISNIKFKNISLVNYVQNEKSVMHQYNFAKLYDLERMYYVRKSLVEQIKLPDDGRLQMYEDLGRILLSYVSRIRYSKDLDHDVYELSNILDGGCFTDILRNMPLHRMGLIRRFMTFLILHKHYKFLIRMIRIIRNE